MEYIGIDISKKSFVTARANKRGGYDTREFENTPKGIRKFILTLDPESSHCVFEATGNYGILLLYLLSGAGIRASLVNPKQIKYYARMMLPVTKTDKKDAALIASFGEKMHPEPYRMPSSKIIELKQKRTVLRQLKKQRMTMCNLLESIEVLPVKDKACVKTVKATIAFLEKQMDHMEQEMAEIAEDAFAAQLKLLTSVKGIGITLATALIIATGGFTYFDNAKQFARYVGLCPTVVQSGSSINIRGSINRNGDPTLRGQLYMASWSAIQYNAACKETYERLKSKGKPSKVALVAVSNKLIRQAFAVVTSGCPYVDGFVSPVSGNLQHDSSPGAKAKPNT